MDDKNKQLTISIDESTSPKVKIFEDYNIDIAKYNYIEPYILIDIGLYAEKYIYDRKFLATACNEAEIAGKLKLAFEQLNNIVYTPATATTEAMIKNLLNCIGLSITMDIYDGSICIHQISSPVNSGIIIKTN